LCGIRSHSSSKRKSCLHPGKSYSDVFVDRLGKLTAFARKFSQYHNDGGDSDKKMADMDARDVLEMRYVIRVSRSIERCPSFLIDRYEQGRRIFLVCFHRLLRDGQG
jgi:hypothetical protein